MVNHTFNEIDTLLEDMQTHTRGNADLDKILNVVKKKVDSLKMIQTDENDIDNEGQY